MKASTRVALAALLILSPVSSATAAGGQATTALGALSVKSDPAGAAVYLDGRLAGQTPMSLDRLPTGDHRVRVVKDGYLENGRVVNIGAGRPTEVQVALTAQAPAAMAAAGQTVRRPGTTAGGTETGSGRHIINKSFLLGAAAGVGGAGAAGYLLLHNTRPTAGAIAVSPTSTGMAGVTNFSFTAQGAADRNGDTLTYSWTFGDGASATGASASHIYANAGSYAVHVTVGDGKSSASPPDVTVSVGASMAGIWTGGVEPGFGTAFTVSPTQTGSTLGGTAAFGGIIGQTVAITGSVSPTTYPTSVTFTTASFSVAGFPGTFTVVFSGATNAAGTVMTGTITTNSTALSPASQSSTNTLSR